MIFALLFLLSAGLNILLGWHDWPAVLAGSLNDPDSYMRLLRIEQGIRAGHLLVSVARDDSGAGVYVEWSRLLDMLLWLLALPLVPVLGWHKALFAAGVALGPLGIGFLGMVLAWAVEPFAARRYLWSTALAAALLPAFTTLAMPGVVHYHVLLLAMIALTAGFVARAWRDARGAGFLAGLAGGLAIWLTPETMPFILAAYAVLLFRWLQARNAIIILAVAAGCFDVLMFGLFIDPPGAGYADPAVDRLSYVYVIMALLLMLGGLVLVRLEAKLRHWRGPFGIVLFGALMAGWVALFPRVAMGPYGILPPAEAHAFFGVISEQQPLHGLELPVFLLPGFCALIYALGRAFAGRRRAFNTSVAGAMLLGVQRSQPVLWLYIAFCIAVSLVLGARFMLFAGFSGLFGAALLPVALSQASAVWAHAPLRAAMARLSCLALVLLAPLGLALAAPAPAAKPRAVAYPSCSLRHIAPLVTQAAGQVVLAEPQDAPELLYRTQVETVGSLYHHGIAGFMRDRAAWRSQPQPTPPPEFIATMARFVLFCPSPPRYALVQDAPPTTLWDALEAGTPPPWLRLAGRNADGWQLYKQTP